MDCPKCGGTWLRQFDGWVSCGNCGHDTYPKYYPASDPELLARLDWERKMDLAEEKRTSLHFGAFERRTAGIAKKYQQKIQDYPGLAG